MLLRTAVLLLAVAPAMADVTIRGRVLDADGKPVAGAEVGTGWKFGKKPAARVALKTGEDGAFSILVKHQNPPIGVLATDSARERGAVAVVED